MSGKPCSILSAVLVSLGCGRIDTSGETDGAPRVTPDAESESAADAAAPDAVAPRCDPAAPFEVVAAASELNRPGSTGDALDEYARLSPDELTVYFSTTRSGTFDIFMAERSDPDDGFARPIPLRGVNTPDKAERVPTVTADGLSIFAAQEFPTAGEQDRYQYQVVGATRPGADDPFGALSVLADVNDPAAQDVDPHVLSDGSALYFASTRNGSLDLFRSPRSGGAFGSPVAVAGIELNLGTNEEAAVVTDDELTIYFSSDRTGGGDIYVATRESVADDFGRPEPIEGLNTPDNLDWPTWISPDGCILYFSRSQGVGQTGYDIYTAQRGR
jgi:Tol biopolymer transport system component